MVVHDRKHNSMYTAQKLQHNVSPHFTSCIHI